uniref:Uncharacterized protein n=1 Tax=Aegilops tauschii TaxID=37682 RepID=R7W273_AEGTA
MGSTRLLPASVAAFFLSPSPSPAADEKPPEPVELAIGVAGHEGWLDALRAWAKLACLKLRPLEPRCDLRSSGSMKKAARQSLAMGKEAVEHTAVSAARAAEETIGRTTEKTSRKCILVANSCIDSALKPCQSPDVACAEGVVEPGFGVDRRSGLFPRMTAPSGDRKLENVCLSSGKPGAPGSCMNVLTISAKG